MFTFSSSSFLGLGFDFRCGEFCRGLAFDILGFVLGFELLGIDYCIPFGLAFGHPDGYMIKDFRYEEILVHLADCGCWRVKW